LNPLHTANSKTASHFKHHTFTDSVIAMHTDSFLKLLLIL